MSHITAYLHPQLSDSGSDAGCSHEIATHCKDAQQKMAAIRVPNPQQNQTERSKQNQNRTQRDESKMSDQIDGTKLKPSPAEGKETAAQARYTCPDCGLAFSKWGVCRKHLIKMNHADPQMTSGLLQRCMTENQMPCAQEAKAGAKKAREPVEGVSQNAATSAMPDAQHISHSSVESVLEKPLFDEFCGASAWADLIISEQDTSIGIPCRVGAVDDNVRDQGSNFGVGNEHNDFAGTRSWTGDRSGRVSSAYDDRCSNHTSSHLYNTPPSDREVATSARNPFGAAKPRDETAIPSNPFGAAKPRDEAAPPSRQQVEQLLYKEDTIWARRTLDRAVNAEKEEDTKERMRQAVKVVHHAKTKIKDDEKKKRKEENKKRNKKRKEEQTLYKWDESSSSWNGAKAEKEDAPPHQYQPNKQPTQNGQEMKKRDLAKTHKQTVQLEDQAAAAETKASFEQLGDSSVELILEAKKAELDLELQREIEALVGK